MQYKEEKLGMVGQTIYNLFIFIMQYALLDNHTSK
jgi:hypothetical protein